MTCKDCVYAVQPTTTMRCRNHGINMTDNAVVCNEFKGRTQTNADRIRSMTDGELAKFISGKARTFGEEYEGYMSALDWLKQEVDE